MTWNRFKGRAVKRLLGVGVSIAMVFSSLPVSPNMVYAEDLPDTEMVIPVEVSEMPVETTEEPVVETTEDPIMEPTEDPIMEPTEVPVIEPTEDPIIEPTEDPIMEPTEVPVEETTEVPVEETTEVPVVETTEVPVVETTEVPVVETTEVPVVETTEVPVVETTEVPVVETTQAPVVETTQAPVVETTQAPVVETTEVPVVETTEVPVVETTQAPVATTEAPATTEVPATPSGSCEWDAAAILAATKTDKGLTLCGEGWSNNVATDDKTFEDGYSAKGDNAKAGSVKAQVDGVNATGQIPNGGCYVQYDATSNGKFYIDTKVGNNKTFYVVDNEGTKVIEYKNTSGASEYKTIEVEVVAGNTYYAYQAGATAQIWKMYFEKTVYRSVWNAADILGATEKSNGLTLCGEGWTNNVATDDKTFEDGCSAKGDNAKAGSVKAQIDGVNATGQIPNGGCYIKYEAEDAGKLTIDTKVGNGKIFYIVNSDSEKVVEYKNSSGASEYKTLEVMVESGKTYYAYQAGATAQIWKVEFIPEALIDKTVEWSKVAAPVITSVTVVDGNFVVGLDAVVDKAKGATNVQVTMYCDGNEVKTINVTAPTEEITFVPVWSGDYSFKAVAQRPGEADKISEVVEYKGYILAVKKPVIEMAQNKGNGTVYLDWINIDDADSFNVYYKLSGTSDYTLAIENDTTGNATLSGLNAGYGYDFKIEAKRNSDGYVSNYVKEEFVVTDKDVNNWYVATVGSAQQSNVDLVNSDHSDPMLIRLSSRDDAAVKVGLVSAIDITNDANGSAVFAATDNGKISDGEEGFQYYFTMIDPNTENFELTATFEITDVSLTPDNQSGFGIIASDMLGYNFWGQPDYVHKLFNSVSTQLYSAKSLFMGSRAITGYESIDTTSFDGVTRTTTQKKFGQTAASFELGSKYTFTLKKTDEAWVSICNGEEVTYDNLPALSVQEDGSIAVGVFSARKIGVKVTDIQFSKSESKGVGKSEVVKTVTPYSIIASSGVANSDVYEYIYTSNVAGELKVYDNAGALVKTQTLAADEVARIGVPVVAGSNVIKSEFTPDPSQDITSYATMTKTTAVEYKVVGNTERILYVGPNGTATAKGTKEDPMDIHTAVKYAQPGQFIRVLDGTYTGSTLVIERSISGTADKPIKLIAENPGKVIFEGMGMNIVGSYWHIYGIYVHYPSAVGIQICGNYNTIEMCTVEGSGNTGIQISRSGSAENKAGIEGLLWPSYNLVKNCESFDNCDAGRNDADGFAAKLTCGNGNVFYGCIAHNNIDDGWDLFAKTISGEIGAVVIDNCVAYANGYLTYEGKDDPTKVGEGNGFKLGGSYMKGGHVLKNSVAFANLAKGITSNSCPDCKIYNCTSYGNAIKSDAAYNVGLNTKESNRIEWVVEGLISMTSPEFTKTADLIPFSYSNENNYIYNGTESRNNQGEVATDDWFVSVDVSIAPTRNEDGTINMHDVLVIKDGCVPHSGGRLDVTSDDAKSVAPTMEEPEELFSGLAMAEDGNWYYYVDGVVDTTANGLVFDETVGWWYVANGAIDFSYTGLAMVNDTWFYVEGGMLNVSYTGLVYHAEHGIWYYVTNGVLDTSYAGLSYVNGWWYYVEGGQINWNYTGCTYYAEHGAWYYVTNGALDIDFTGLSLVNGWWYYVFGGQIDFNYTGCVYHAEHGIWYYVTNGVLDIDYTGLAYVNGWWYYVFGGQIDFSYTGLVYHAEHGIWYYVTNGVLDVDYVGLVFYNGMWFYVFGGQVDWNYTGTTVYNGMTFYVVNGVLA